MSQTALVALGSNLGDSVAIVQAAIRELNALPGTAVLAQSSLHRTAPVGGPGGQPDFVNGVVELNTTLAPEALLRELQRIETRHGRNRAEEERWGPRLLDLDLLMMGDLRMQSETLELPHPRLEERSFVLDPLAEIRPELLLSRCQQTVRERSAALRAQVIA